tara:strand:+ start:2019 stop:2609 length:591 start_codon:yes stop_codon:yes gene_type:complete
MIKSFEFYFDFASPYTFLAHKEIRRIEKENLIEIKYKPVLLGALLKLAGLKPLIDIPIKGKYMIKDCKLWAEKYNIDFKFNNYFPIISLTLMRCVLVAKKKGFEKKFIDKMFDGIWRENLNLNDNLILEKSLKKINVDPKKLLIEASENSIKEELKIRTNDAYNKGVFGTPTFMVNNKIFWGQDRLEFVLNEANKS